VYSPQTETHELYRYPLDVFPPTDFHTATLLGDTIWIIGNLGYTQNRGTVTPVYQLNVNTLAIHGVEVGGDHNPGWIYKHKAWVKGDDVIEITHNTDAWELNVLRREWRKTSGA
jgi:hypothetical protein